MNASFELSTSVWGKSGRSGRAGAFERRLGGCRRGRGRPRRTHDRLRIARAGRSVLALDAARSARARRRAPPPISPPIDDRYSMIERLHGEGARRSARAKRRRRPHRVDRRGRSASTATSSAWTATSFSARATSRVLERELDAATGRTGRCRLGERAGRRVRHRAVSALSRAGPVPSAQVSRRASRAAVSGRRPDPRDTVVVARSRKASEVVVRTQCGPMVRAREGVVATNSPINDRFAIHTKQAPYRTYAIGGPRAGARSRTRSTGTRSIPTTTRASSPGRGPRVGSSRRGRSQDRRSDRHGAASRAGLRRGRVSASRGWEQSAPLVRAGDGAGGYARPSSAAIPATGTSTLRRATPARA